MSRPGAVVVRSNARQPGLQVRIKMHFHHFERRDYRDAYQLARVNSIGAVARISQLLQIQSLLQPSRREFVLLNVCQLGQMDRTPSQSPAPSYRACTDRLVPPGQLSRLRSCGCGNGPFVETRSKAQRFFDICEGFLFGRTLASGISRSGIGRRASYIRPRRSRGMNDSWPHFLRRPPSLASSPELTEVPCPTSVCICADARMLIN